MTASLRRASLVAALVAVLGIAGCVTLPEGPTQAALPGSRQTFDQFQVDDAGCRQFAVQALGGVAGQAALMAGPCGASADPGPALHGVLSYPSSRWCRIASTSTASTCASWLYSAT